MTGLQVGLVVDAVSKQTPLTQLIQQAGHQVVCRQLLGAEIVPDLVQPQVWLIDVSHDHEPGLVEQLLEQNQIPVLLIDSADTDDQSSWLKRTQQRLQQLAGDIELHKQKAADECWILAASTGGPAAVKAFIQALPDHLPVAFVYIQHIDPKQGESLARSLSKSSAYPCELASHGAVLSPGKIMLLTSRERVEVMANKTLYVHSQSQWGGCYTPSIDQLTANLAHIYKQFCGLIMFTGLGDDGAASCRLLSQQGGRVWAQTPESATSDSMPQSAIATGCVSMTGTPEQLARALAAATKLSTRIHLAKE